MGELIVCTLLWDRNRKSFPFSRCYDESWVEKLYSGFRRHLQIPFRFVLYTDRIRELPTAIVQEVRPRLGKNGYADCILPYEMGEPMILVGLDTVVTGDCRALGEYCLTARLLALPRDPYRPERACNGVALVPANHRDIALKHRRQNDMDWVRCWPHTFTDDRFPGRIVSYKGRVEKHGVGDARIVYFHGEKKPHQLRHLPWIQEHWNVDSVHSRRSVEAE